MPAVRRGRHERSKGIAVRGTVKNWNEERGFGFISPDSGGDDIFVHANGLPDGYQSLARGVTVEFDTFMAEKGMQGRVLSVGDFAPPADPSDSPQPDVRARPQGRRAGAAPKHQRVPLWTPERRTEIAERAVEVLFKIAAAPQDQDQSAPVEALRLILEAVNADMGE